MRIASQYLGFSWRHTPFHVLRESVSLENVWILSQDSAPTGFALTQRNESILRINNLLLRHGIDAAEAVAAVIAGLKTAYIQVTTSRPGEVASLQRAGYSVAHPNWNAFMVKPLTPEVTIADARRLFGIGTDRFLISWLDTT